MAYDPYFSYPVHSVLAWQEKPGLPVQRPRFPWPTVFNLSFSTSSVGTIGLGETQTVQTTSTGTVIVTSNAFQTVNTTSIGSSSFTANSGDLGAKRYRR